MEYQFDLVGKIGSMALIREEDQEIDYNIISRLGADLKPGMIWVTSGATEIGRLDYIKRTGRELNGDPAFITSQPYKIALYCNCLKNSPQLTSAIARANL